MKTLLKSLKYCIAMALLFNTVMTIHAQKTLVLWHADKTQTEIQLFAETKVEFKGDKIKISSPVINMEYDAKDVLTFTYKNVSTDIKSTSTNAMYSLLNGNIVFNGVSGIDDIMLFSANGQRMPVRIVYDGNNATVRISMLPVGVYIIYLNGRTSKFVKQ